MNMVPVSTAILASVLLLAGTTPASAVDPCDRLRGMALGAAATNIGGGQASYSLAPANVSVQLDAGAPVVVSWDIPSEIPAEPLTGWCVKQNFETFEREICTGEPERTVAYLANCVLREECPPGSHTFKVKLRTDCGFDLPYSDGVSISLAR